MSTEVSNSDFGITCRLFYSGQYRTPHARARSRATMVTRARATRVTSASLEASQKNQIHLLFFKITCRLFHCGQHRSPQRAPPRARVTHPLRGSPRPPYKASQKFQTQFVELHVDISIVHNIEFHSARRRARGGARARAGDPPIAWVTAASASPKFQIQLLKLHVVFFSIVDNIELRSARRSARAHARGVIA